MAKGTKIGLARTYTRGGTWWIDGRAYDDVGGKRESLGTKDPVHALALARERVAEWERLQRAGLLAGPSGLITLGDAAVGFINDVADREKEEDTIDHYRWACRWLFRLMDPEMLLSDLSVGHVKELKKILKKTQTERSRKSRTGKKKILSNRSQRGIVKALQQIVEWAQREQHLDARFDPVRPQLKGMKATGKKTDYLEPRAVAYFLDAVLELEGGMTPKAMYCFGLAYSGGRPGGTAGLLISDIDRRFGMIRFQCNEWRNIKGREKGWRYVPIHPDLEIALDAYAVAITPGPDDLLTPGRCRKTGAPKMLGQLQALFRDAKALAVSRALKDRDLYIAEHIKQANITRRVFRVAYASQRVQTVDQGQPIAPLTVSTELGHQSEQMVNDVYARIGQSRYRERRAFVSYRLPDGSIPGEAWFRAELGDDAVDHAKAAADGLVDAEAS